MKEIIPSDFRHIITSKFKVIISKIKEINFSKLMKTFSEKLNQLVPDKVKQLIPAKYHKWAIFALALILILLLVCCFRGCAAEEVIDPIVCTVSAENLNVHKNFDADSSVDSQLPKGLEIQIVEQKTADGIEWGRIETMKLPDGTKVKGGWINLEHVRFPGEPDPDAIENIPTEPVTEPVTVVLPDPEQGITTMGTVTTGKLNIRKGAGSKYDAFDAYYEGDRIEIQEIITVDDTQWGRTGKGWIGMGYVRLDGTAPSAEESSDNAKKIVSDGKHKVLGYGVVDLGELNVRQGPGTEYEKVDTVFEGVRYAYYQTQGDWIRIENGWVSNAYFYVEGTAAMDGVSGVITTDDLNIRTGPGTTFKSVATAKNGDAVKILGQVNGWGYTANGWINMTHVKITFTTGAGTVTTGLNIRKEPNPASDQVGTYSEGDSVTILEVSDEWGRTELGWINLNYVSLS